LCPPTPTINGAAGQWDAASAICPGAICVLGGGEGATVREALKWKTIKRVVMVDIDAEVVESCKKHLPEMHQGAFEDPRTEVVIGDALDYLDHSENEWDIIISDLSDPIEQFPDPGSID